METHNIQSFMYYVPGLHRVELWTWTFYRSTSAGIRVGSQAIIIARVDDSNVAADGIEHPLCTSRYPRCLEWIERKAENDFVIVLGHIEIQTIRPRLGYQRWRTSKDSAMSGLCLLIV